MAGFPNRNYFSMGDDNEEELDEETEETGGAEGKEGAENDEGEEFYSTGDIITPEEEIE